jgi:hypothetical protein
MDAININAKSSATRLVAAWEPLYINTLVCLAKEIIIAL